MTREPSRELFDLEFTVNGNAVRVQTDPTRTLLEVLREDLGLTGAKPGCGVGECGGCTVILDDRTVNACLVLAGQLTGRSVRTVEGLGGTGWLHPVQEAFISEHAVQCGYCTTGVIMSTVSLLERVANPTDEEIKQALSGHLCRCTGYVKILDAVRRAAGALAEMRQDG